MWENKMAEQSVQCTYISQKNHKHQWINNALKKTIPRIGCCTTNPRNSAQLSADRWFLGIANQTFHQLTKGVCVKSDSQDSWFTDWMFYFQSDFIPDVGLTSNFTRCAWCLLRVVCNSSSTRGMMQINIEPTVSIFLITPRYRVRITIHWKNIYFTTLKL